MSEGRGDGGSGGSGGGWRWIQCQRANVGQGNAATFDEDWGRMRRCDGIAAYTTKGHDLDSTTAESK